MSRTVVITGASAGVGRACAEASARDGWQVGLLARGTDGLEGARATAERLGSRALVLPTDVADPAAVEAAASRVEADLGPITAWVNAAMITSYSPVVAMDAAEFRRISEVVYLGAVHGTMTALARMRGRRGVIVQVGRHLPTGRCRCNPLTAARSLPCVASPRRSGRSCGMRGRRSGLR